MKLKTATSIGDTDLSSLRLASVCTPLVSTSCSVLCRRQPFHLREDNNPIELAAMTLLNYKDSLRLNHLLKVCAGGVVTFLLWTLAYTPCPADHPGCFNTHLARNDVHHPRSLETKVVSHAPGFTTIDGAYWRNHTWVFVTSKPWSFPPMQHVVTNGPWHNEEIRWDDTVARIITPREAKELGLEIDDAVNVEGSSVSLAPKLVLVLHLPILRIADHFQ